MGQASFSRVWKILGLAIMSLSLTSHANIELCKKSIENKNSIARDVNFINATNPRPEFIREFKVFQKTLSRKDRIIKTTDWALNRLDDFSVREVVYIAGTLTRPRFSLFGLALPLPGLQILGRQTIQALDRLMTEYASMHSAALTPNLAIKLAIATGTEKAQDTILKNFIETSPSEISVKDIVNLASASATESAQDQMIATYLKQNAAHLITTDIIKLAKATATERVQDSVILDFTENQLRAFKESDLDVSHIIDLAHETATESAQNKVILDFISSKAKNISSVDAIRLAEVTATDSAQNKVLEVFLNEQVMTLSTPEVLQLAETAATDRGGNEILLLLCQIRGTETQSPRLTILG